MVITAQTSAIKQRYRDTKPANQVVITARRVQPPDPLTPVAMAKWQKRGKEQVPRHWQTANKFWKIKLDHPIPDYPHLSSARRLLRNIPKICRVWVSPDSLEYWLTANPEVTLQYLWGHVDAICQQRFKLQRAFAGSLPELVVYPPAPPRARVPIVPHTELNLAPVLETPPPMVRKRLQFSPPTPRTPAEMARMQNPPAHQRKRKDEDRYSPPTPIGMPPLEPIPVREWTPLCELDLTPLLPKEKSPPMATGAWIPPPEPMPALEEETPPLPPYPYPHLLLNKK